MMEKYVVINMANQEFGINIQNVTSIEKVSNPTVLPKMEEYIKGIVNIRGTIYPVIDSSQLFFNTSTILTDQTRFIMIKTEDIVTCFLVDHAKEILSINDDEIKPFNQMSSSSSLLFEGIVTIQERLISIINVKEMIDSLNDFSIIQAQVEQAGLNQSI
jgi:purine-binding chemotaxis protein CheW